MNPMIAWIALVLVLVHPLQLRAGVPEQAETDMHPAVANGIEAGDIDHATDACDDFYQFANGTWRSSNPIPAGLPRWSRRVAAHEANRQRIIDILEEDSRAGGKAVGSAEQLVGDHYASCINTTAVDAAGLSPLQPLLAQIDAVRNRTDLQRAIRRLHEIAVFVPFSTAGAPDYDNPMQSLVNISAGALGLPGREYYLAEDPAHIDARTRYVTHVSAVLRLSGMDGMQAASAADRILALEKALATTALDNTAAADPAGTSHKMTFAQLTKLAPHIDWIAYFDEGGLPRRGINVAEPKLLKEVDRQLAATPLTTWKLYLRWQLLDSAAPWLPAVFARESFEFRERYLAKASSMKSRQQTCADSVEALLPEALGRRYVDRYFSPAAKAKAREIARNLLTTFKEMVAEEQWLDTDTKRRALAKLSVSNVQVGYPDTWKDYSSITIRAETLWINIAAARRFQVRYDRRQIAKPTNRSLWVLAPSSADAYIDLQLNELVLPAGALQPPYFNPTASDAVNYGAFGVGLAHDMTHAIDGLGSQIDVQGRPRTWWPQRDTRKFNERSQCLVDQYDGYFIEPGVHHDGRRVLSESTADLAGVRIAYRALEKSMQVHAVPIIDGFTPEQQFFIAWGQSAGAAMRIESQRQLVRDDPHPVPRFRVVGPLSDTAEFQQAFSCKDDAAMVRRGPNRCEVW